MRPRPAGVLTLASDSAEPPSGRDVTQQDLGGATVSVPARQLPSDIPHDDGDLGLSHPAHIGPRPDAEHARLSLALEASTDLVLTATRGDDRIRMNPAAARILADSPDADPTTDLDSLLARTPSWVRHRFLNEAAPALEA